VIIASICVFFANILIPLDWILDPYSMNLKIFQVSISTQKCSYNVPYCAQVPRRSSGSRDDLPEGVRICWYCNKPGHTRNKCYFNPERDPNQPMFNKKFNKKFPGKEDWEFIRFILKILLWKSNVQFNDVRRQNTPQSDKHDEFNI